MKYLHFFPRKVESFLFMIMLIALLAPARMWGQVTVVYPINSSNTSGGSYGDMPLFCNMNRYALSEMIYLKEEITGHASWDPEKTAITRISFYVRTAGDKDFNVKVFMKNVERTSFSASDYTEKEREEELERARKLNENAKPGSLTAKANLVKEYNEKNNRD